MSILAARFNQPSSPRSHFRSGRRGFTLIEIAIGAIIIVIIGIPAMTLWQQSQGTVFRSRLAILSAMAAQEEIEEYRLLARVAGYDLPGLSHDWEPVSKHSHMLAFLTGENKGRYTLADGNFDGDQIKYPKVYERIWTKVIVEQSRTGLVYPGTLFVVWQEKGETITDEAARKRPAFAQYEFHLVRPVSGV